MAKMSRSMPKSIMGGNGLSRGPAVKAGSKSPGTSRTPGPKDSPNNQVRAMIGVRQHNGKGLGGPTGGDGPWKGG